MRRGALLAVCLLAVGCSVTTVPSATLVSTQEPAEPSPPAAAPGPPDPAAGLPYACGGHPFDIGLLSLPPQALFGGDGPADALREHARLDGLNRGWWLTHRSATEAEFLAMTGPALFDYVRFRQRADGTWEWSGEGDCEAQFLIDGVATLRWAVDTNVPVDLESTVVPAVVSLPCGSIGVGNIRPPIIRSTADTVLIVFTAGEPGALGEDESLRRAALARASGGLGSRRNAGPLFDHCAPGPPVSVRVDLGEPLGDRRLLDGATWPARNARQPLEP